MWLVKYRRYLLSCRERYRIVSKCAFVRVRIARHTIDFRRSVDARSGAVGELYKIDAIFLAVDCAFGTVK